MNLAIEAHLGFSVDQPTDTLLQIELAETPGQEILKSELAFSPQMDFSRVEGQDALGERIWLKADQKIEVSYRASVAIKRKPADLAALTAPDTQAVPAYAIPYLFDTRYCFAEPFQSFVESEFAGTSGGERIIAIKQWIADKFTYSPGASTSETNASDSFVKRAGVCRDYAHVMISLARASGIPARYVACYAPQVDPPDFHAVAQVLLHDPITVEASWHLVDATGMSSPACTAIIGVGRDAADVSFLTTFGLSEFHHCTVRTESHE